MKSTFENEHRTNNICNTHTCQPYHLYLYTYVFISDTEKSDLSKLLYYFCLSRWDNCIEVREQTGRVNRTTCNVGLNEVRDSFYIKYKVLLWRLLNTID